MLAVMVVGMLVEEGMVIQEAVVPAMAVTVTAREHQVAAVMATRVVVAVMVVVEEHQEVAVMVVVEEVVVAAAVVMVMWEVHQMQAVTVVEVHRMYLLQSDRPLSRSAAVGAHRAVKQVYILIVNCLY